MTGTERCRNQNRSSIQVDQPTSGEKVESMVRGGCAHGGNKTKEDDIPFLPFLMADGKVT